MLLSVTNTSNLSKRLEINTQALSFQIPLFQAAKSGNAPTVQLLLDVGTSPTMRDVEGRTALYYVTSLEVVTVLVNAGCPLNSVDNNDYSELDKAINDHRVDVVHALVAAGSTLAATDLRPYGSLMRFCISLEIDADIVQLIIDLGADLYERTAHQQTVLHQATKYISGDRTGKLGNVIKILVNAGLPVDVRDEDNNTPLHIAVGNDGHESSAVNTLLALGANINAVNSRGETPLSIAIFSNAVEIISILLERGANW